MAGSYLMTQGTAKGLDRIVMGKLGKDMDLLDGIREIVRKEKIQTGVILSAVGGFKKAVFSNLEVSSKLKVEDRHPSFLELEQRLDIVSLTGWMATKEDGEIQVHAHFSVSTVMEDKIVTMGGHLIPGAITADRVIIVIGVIEEASVKAFLTIR